AAWNYVAITQWILGIRPEYDGLRIDPCIPSAWTGFEAVRRYRGVRYEIHVERRGTGNEVSLEVDGKAIHGTIIPFPSDTTKNIRVVAKVG
ncbi:MAG: glycosyl hydrolase family 65 protein, partial [Anaerolineales bacterium]